MKPDATYVTRLLMTLRLQFDGVHRKMDELERLRYFEDTIRLPKGEKQSGIEVRTGMTSDLVENVKASIVASPPVVQLVALVAGENAADSASERAAFWNSWIVKKLGRPFPKLETWLDAAVGMGTGILKAQLGDYPKDDSWFQDVNEPNGTYNNRIKALKELNGPPVDVINTHPLSFFYRRGKNMEIVEAIEHSWKSRTDIFRTFGIQDSKDLRNRNIGGRYLSPSVEEMMKNGTDKEVIEAVIATQGQPEQFVRPLPAGTNTATLALVTEYWSPDWYQVYINRTLVYEQENPAVRYFYLTGMSTSSTDIDKVGLSVAEALRHNEPIINRAITRIMEANELLVNKHLTIELPEGSTDGIELDDRGEAVPRKFTFNGEYAEALPAGAKIVDPYDTSHYVFQSMPAIELLMQIMGKQGVAPIFKGIAPGAAGSGYRDNSLYMMAKSRFQYIIQGYANGITELIRWLEAQAVVHQEDYHFDGYTVKWQDVKSYPCSIEVQINPNLPQNVIAEGEFLSQMHDKKLVPKRYVLTEGLHEDNPEVLEQEVLLDEIKEAMIPALIADVLSSVGGVPQQTAGEAAGMPPGGTPPNMNQPPGGPGGAQAAIAEASRRAGNQLGGFTTGGQPRNPSVEPGTLPSRAPAGAGT